MDYKALLGMAAVILNLIAFWPYIIDTVRGKTKPHMYSWLVWTLITGMVFIEQQAHGAGPGAWVTGLTMAINLIIFLLSFKYGTADITRSDRLCLISASAILIVWGFSDSAVLSIVLVTVIDVLAFGPTIRKSIKAPREETFITYPISSMRCFLGILALTNYSVITCAYPLAMLAMYLLITGILIYKQPANLRQLGWRKRRYLGRKQTQMRMRLARGAE